MTASHEDDCFAYLGDRYSEEGSRRGREMDKRRMYELAKELLRAWNSQDVDQVVTRYTEDVVYVDPNTRGEVEGAEALRKYLGKLFSGWRMTWELKDAYLFEDHNGCAVMWHASLRRADGERAVEVDGMDLVIMEGDLVKRNEVYFDRAVIASLM
jgi:ketosteroid isomerase-like protein